MNGLVQLPNCQIDSRLRHLLKLTYSSHPDGELEDTEVRERHCQALPAWCPSCSGCGSAYKCNADPGTENPDRPQRVQSRKFPVRSSSAAKLLAGNLEAAVSVEVDSVNNQDSHNEETSIWETEAMLSILPPVTKDNLKELELPAIQNTLSLRIDLCFDHDLYFQRISGLKGEEKRCKANVFYQCLSAELQSIGHGLLGSCKECDMLRSSQYFTMPSRLGAFFSALRDLLELLVPDKDKEDVIARVDPEWLTCQIRVGQFDAASFAIWLCDLLTSHCAPMRDDMAREMRDKVVEGFGKNDMCLLVEGLRILLNLLENMKIDVANHQVRSFKLLLIADTVPFLQDCFRKLIESNQFEVSCSRKWFNQLSNPQSSQQATEFERFVNGVLTLTWSVDKTLPATFGYDKERIQVLRNDILDLVQLRICGQTYDELATMRNGKTPTTAEAQVVCSRIVQIMTSDEGFSEGVSRHKDAISLEIARAVAGIKVDSKPSHAIALSRNDIRRASARLQRSLQDKHSETLTTTTEELYNRTLVFANGFFQIDTLQISNSQRQWSMTRSAKGFPLEPDVEDISRRLAHIAVIHWQVWSELAYTDKAPGLD